MIPFAVDFADGVSAILFINEWHIRDSDFLARIVAREEQEEQEAGNLRKGEITAVRRLAPDPLDP
jgi:hypothetical protein